MTHRHSWRAPLGRAARFWALMLLLMPAAGAAQTSTPARAGKADLFDEIYQRGRTFDATLKTLTARFTETTTSSLLTRPLVARGTLAVSRPDKVILRYAEPEARVVLIAGDRLTLTWPGRDLRQVTDIGANQRRVQKYFVGASPDELRKQFEIQADEPAGKPARYHLTMVPLRKQIKEGLARLDLWIDRASLLMTAMQMTFPNGDTKLMTFEDVVPNAPVDPALFR
jgi:outer membrane lipoprotein-sorting protein